MTYLVRWWESVGTQNEIEIEAANEDQAANIAMYPYDDDSRGWTKKEKESYYSEVRNTDHKGLIRVEELNE